MKTNRAGLGYLTAVLLAATFLLPDQAQAQLNNGLGAEVQNVAYQTHFSYVLSTFSYVVGIVLAMWGVIKLKAWSDGEQVSVMDGVWRIAGSALMIALPSFWGEIMTSFYGTWGNSASSSYNRITGLQSNYGNGYLGLDQMMENFVIDIYKPAKIVLNWAGYIVGFGCMINGVYRLAQSGQAAAGRAPSAKGTMGFIIGGALMVSFGDAMDAISTTIFGSDAPPAFSGLAYNIPGLNMTQVNNVVQSLFAFVEIVGWVAFVRGIYLLVKLSQGNADRSHAHAFTHIVFGGLAVNMAAVVSAVQNTLGVQIINSGS